MLFVSALGQGLGFALIALPDIAFPDIVLDDIEPPAIVFDEALVQLVLL